MDSEHQWLYYCVVVICLNTTYKSFRRDHRGCLRSRACYSPV